MSESPLLTYLKQQGKSEKVSVKFELMESDKRRMFFDFKTPDGGIVRMQFTTEEAELSYLKWVAAGGLSEDG